MRFKTLAGRERYLDIERSRIKWDGPSLSKFQFNVKQFLKLYWYGCVCYEEMPIVGTRLRVDFYNANKRLAVECNGYQHGKFNKFFHQNNTDKFVAQMKRDDQKFRWCELNGITLIEIEPKDILSPELFERFGVIL